ncbi:hypothetical protein OPV22_025575 [Ensete ventricosum]|uniref:Uncharacterized protein n=1 Tax=Ensete ventricosum TaxID=4639 RepID=A0AAV8Q876_ENSVE|nr:hypothetical protein OPV22_025575 [Ensete ventricosum]
MVLRSRPRTEKGELLRRWRRRRQHQMLQLPSTSPRTVLLHYHHKCRRYTPRIITIFSHPSSGPVAFIRGISTFTL